MAELNDIISSFKINSFQYIFITFKVLFHNEKKNPFKKNQYKFIVV